MASPIFLRKHSTCRRVFQLRESTGVMAGSDYDQENYDITF